MQTALYIIVGFGELPVSGIDDLHRLLTPERVAAAVPLTVLRGTEKRVLHVEPSARPES